MKEFLIKMKSFLEDKILYVFVFYLLIFIIYFQVFIYGIDENSVFNIMQYIFEFMVYIWKDILNMVDLPDLVYSIFALFEILFITIIIAKPLSLLIPKSLINRKSL